MTQKQPNLKLALDNGGRVGIPKPRHVDKRLVRSDYSRRGSDGELVTNGSSGKLPP